MHEWLALLHTIKLLCILYLLHVCVFKIKQ